MNSDLRKLAPFEPLVEEAGNGSNQPATLKRKREQRIWKLQAKCNNKSDAIDIINGENTWSYYYKNKCVDGEKIYYRCNKAKKREQQCPLQISSTQRERRRG